MSEKIIPAVPDFEQSPERAADHNVFNELFDESVKKRVTKILSASDDPDAKEALLNLSSMPEDQVQSIINLAAAHVSEDSRINQYFLGGDFRTETGVPRKRVLMSLDHAERPKEATFLRYLCFKMVPPEAKVLRELRMHAKVQAVADRSEGRLSVPRLVSMIDDQEKKLFGVVMEKLSKNERSGSLQTIIETNKRLGVTMRISSRLSGRIVAAFSEMHENGFLHGDINDGNVYLTNAVMKDYRLPAEKGRRRPSKLKIVFDAGVHVMDFERTWELPDKESAKKKKDVAVEAEEKEVSKMADQFMMTNVNPDSSLDEVVSANDEYFEGLE